MDWKQEVGHMKTGYGEDYDREYRAKHNTMGSWLAYHLRSDDRQGFVSMVKTKLEYDKSPATFGREPPPYAHTELFFEQDLWDWALLSQSVNCIAAMLEGETGIPVDIDDVTKYDLRPLYEAASNLNYDLVKLFLSHGARTDLKTDNLLPINAALESCSSVLYDMSQNSHKSFNNLLITLCEPEMEKYLEIVRLLACETRDLSKVFNDYAKEGNLIEMAVLGIVAKDCVIPSKDASALNGSMTVRESILQEIVSVTAAEKKLSEACRIELVQKCKAKTAALISAAMLLDLFEKAGDAIGSYFRSIKINMPKGRVIKDVEAILEKAGFFFKDIDFSNIDRESSEIKAEIEAAVKALEMATTDTSQQHLGLPLDPQPDRFHDAKWKTCSSFPRSSPALRSEHLVNHFRSQHYSGFSKPMEFQSTTATPRAVRTKSSKLFSSLASTFRRVIRHA